MVVWWRDVGKVCRCHTSDGQVYWVGGPFESCKQIEEWEREEGRRVWCFEEY
jgi:hypothetical protein